MPTAKPSDEKTSVIKLTLFSILKFPQTRKTDALPRILAGASNVERINGKLSVQLASVPLMDSQTPPDESKGILALYGFKDQLEEVAARRQEARNAGAEFKFLEIECEVGRIEEGLIDREKLRKLRFANVKRMTAELQTEILERFAEYVGDEGGDAPASMSRVQQIAMRPDLFGQLMSDDKDFKNIEVLVIPVLGSKTHHAKVRQVAIVRPKAKIVRASGNGDDDLNLVLPKGYSLPK